MSDQPHLIQSGLYWADLDDHSEPPETGPDRAPTPPHGPATMTVGGPFGPNGAEVQVAVRLDRNQRRLLAKALLGFGGLR